MKYFTFLLLLYLTLGCKSSFETVQKRDLKHTKLSLEIANQLIELPINCVRQEYPNKLGQVISEKEDLATPIELHPVFYGCFDWHSAVHGHWSLVKLLKEFPDVAKAKEIKKLLQLQITKEK